MKEALVKKKALLAAALAAAAMAAAYAASPPPDDPLDPARVAGDTHKVALDNPFVRVLDVRLPPGKVEPRHRHPHGMSVYFTDWDAKVTPDGGGFYTGEVPEEPAEAGRHHEGT